MKTGTPGHEYVFRRNITDGELAYFHVYSPRGEPLRELVRVIGCRWPIEECFEAAKQEAGLDQYQFRLYRAWYRHATMSMLALTFLAVLRHIAKKGNHSLWTTIEHWRDTRLTTPTKHQHHGRPTDPTTHPPIRR